MKYAAKKVFLLFLVWILVGTGCASLETTKTEEALPDLKILTRQAEVAVAFEGATLESGERQFLEKVSAKEPSHLRYLDSKGYKTRVAIMNGHAVLLLCTPDGKRALFETIACAHKKPKRHKDASIPMACEFTYSQDEIAELCDE